MEQLGSRRIPSDSLVRHCEGHVPLLSQAGASPISTLCFYTQGIAEDTTALYDGVLDDREYLDQARTVLAEHRRIFDEEFPKFQKGAFFFYFSSLDLKSHMVCG